VPLAAAFAVVVALGGIGWVVFGGDDDEPAAAPWQLLRIDADADAIQRVVVSGDVASYEPLGVLTAFAQGHPASTLVTMTDDDAGVVTVIDTAIGETRSITADLDGLILTRFGDLLVGTAASGEGGVFIDLRAGIAVDLHRAFGVPSDYRLFSAQPARDGVGVVYGDAGAGVFSTTSPELRQWFDGAVYDAAGTQVVAGSVGAERTLTLYDNGVEVGSPITVEGRVRVRLQSGTTTALVVDESGRVLLADFSDGSIDERGRVDPAAMAELAGGDVSGFFLADDRFLVELEDGWALLDDSGSLVARFAAGEIEPGATEISLRGFGDTCFPFAVGGDVPDRTAIVDIATGEVRIAVAGQVFGPQSLSGCSLITGGNAEIVVVDGAVVSVPGIVVAYTPDFSQLVVRSDQGPVDSRTATLYTVRDGELVDPVELESGSFLFVPAAD